jgi:ribosomal protein S18 acetylase RimI-like enzyme
LSRAEPALSLRPATAADRDFLAALYASTREEELAAAPFTAEERAAFLDQQFEAQALHYERNYRDTSHDVVLVDGEPAGRLIVGRWPEEVRIVDIALLPERRGRGIGERLLRSVIAEAEQRGVRATVHVEPLNPAIRLYERLGFVAAGEEGIHLLMERRPAAGGGGQAKIAS